MIKKYTDISGYNKQMDETIKISDSPVLGSPEWFYLKAQEPEMVKQKEIIEKCREGFLKLFSPDNLASMNGEELLTKVFSKIPSSMMSILLSGDQEYCLFGGICRIFFYGIIYQLRNSAQWKYNTEGFAKIISQEEAIKKAVFVRDKLIECINEIEKSGIIKTDDDYRSLKKRLNAIAFFPEYFPIMKYYHMIYPQFFPTYYSINDINRVIDILGIPEKPKNNKIVNAGKISRFIRQSGVNSTLFYQIFRDEFKEDNGNKPCPNAKINKRVIENQIDGIDLELYETNDLAELRKKERIAKALEIDKEMDAQNLKGDERHAIINVRVGQSVFRERLLKKYDGCCICGLSKQSLLVSSHIKPWKLSSPEEKLDDNNGFLLCPNHDKLFDRGLISFHDSGQIIISSEIRKEDRALLRIDNNVSIKIFEKQKVYLNYHRKHIF